MHLLLHASTYMLACVTAQLMESMQIVWRLWCLSIAAGCDAQKVLQLRKHAPLNIVKAEACLWLTVE